MAGTINSFSFGEKKVCFLCKMFSLFLPCMQHGCRAKPLFCESTQRSACLQISFCYRWLRVIYHKYLHRALILSSVQFPETKCTSLTRNRIIKYRDATTIAGVTFTGKFLACLLSDNPGQKQLGHLSRITYPPSPMPIPLPPP